MWINEGTNVHIMDSVIIVFRCFVCGLHVCMLVVCLLFIAQCVYQGPVRLFLPDNGCYGRFSSDHSGRFQSKKLKSFLQLA